MSGGWVQTSVPWSKRKTSWSYNKHPVKEQGLTLYCDEGPRVLTWRGAWGCTVQWESSLWYTWTTLYSPSLHSSKTCFHNFSSNTLSLLSSQPQCQHMAWRTTEKVLLERRGTPISCVSDHHLITLLQLEFFAYLCHSFKHGNNRFGFVWLLI